MFTADWPRAIEHATGFQEARSRYALRRLREAGLIPTGNQPLLTATDVTRIILAMTASTGERLADEVRELEALPTRYVPDDGTPTAGIAIVKLIDDLRSATARPIGAIEVSRELSDIRIHTLSNDSTPIVQQFGIGDPTVYRCIASTLIVPLVAVAALADALGARR
jgi:hypothetical protein